MRTQTRRVTDYENSNTTRHNINNIVLPRSHKSLIHQTNQATKSPIRLSSFIPSINTKQDQESNAFQITCS